MTRGAIERAICAALLVLAALGASTRSSASAQDAPADAPPTADPAGGPVPDAQAALVKPRVRKVGVPRFTGRSADSMRQAALDVLSAHPDIEVVGQSDMDVVTHHGQGKTDSAADRVRLALELGLYAWIDGDGSRGTLTVTNARGEMIAALDLDPSRRTDLETQERLWPALGRFLSDEGLRRALVLESKAEADRMLAALNDERGRQRELAKQHATERADRLTTLKGHAQKRLSAQRSELGHQIELAGERARKEEQARQVELAKQAEATRRAQLAQQAQMQAQQQAQPSFAAAAPPAAASTFAGSANAGRGYDRPANWQQPAYAQPQPAYAQPAYAQPQPAPAYVQQPAAPAPDPGGPVVDGVSPETKRWLAEHRAKMQAGGAPPSAPGP
ncbi:MAG: hypothetical protein ACHQ53_02275 [Polyangiales bacterium]